MALLNPPYQLRSLTLDAKPFYSDVLKITAKNQFVQQEFKATEMGFPHPSPPRIGKGFENGNSWGFKLRQVWSFDTESVRQGGQKPRLQGLSNLK